MALADYLIKTYPNCVFTLAGNDISSFAKKWVLGLPDIFWCMALSTGLFGFQVWLPSQNFGYCVDDFLCYLDDNFPSVFSFCSLVSLSYQRSVVAREKLITG